VPTNETVIRILLVGEAKGAQRVRELLESDGSTQFQIEHVMGLDVAAERLSSDNVDVLLLDMSSRRQQGRAIVQAARAAAPDKPW